MANFGDTSTVNIYFYGEEGNGTGTATEPKDEGTPNKKDPTATKDYLGTAAVMTIKQTANTLVNYAVSHVQQYTGSSVKQANVNAGMMVAKKAINLGTAYATNVYMGLAQTVMEVTNLLLEYKDMMYKIQQDNRRTEQNIYRAGPNFNRSRM